MEMLLVMIAWRQAEVIRLWLTMRYQYEKYVLVVECGFKFYGKLFISKVIIRTVDIFEKDDTFHLSSTSAATAPTQFDQTFHRVKSTFHSYGRQCQKSDVCMLRWVEANKRIDLGDLSHHFSTNTTREMWFGATRYVLNQPPALIFVHVSERKDIFYICSMFHSEPFLSFHCQQSTRLAAGGTDSPWKWAKSKYRWTGGRT